MFQFKLPSIRLITARIAYSRSTYTIEYIFFVKAIPLFYVGTSTYIYSRNAVTYAEENFQNVYSNIELFYQREKLLNFK